MTEAAKKNEEVRAKLFTNGRSQAVRLPKEFRFEGKEVRIRKLADGVLLEPIKEERKPWRSIEELYERFEDADPIFPEGREQPEAQERDWGPFV